MKVWLAAVLLLLTVPALAEDVASNARGDLENATCDYPAAALAAKVQGFTTVSYTGRANGSIGNVKIIFSSGNNDLDKAAVDCVSHWHFNPATALGALERGQHRNTVRWMIPGTAGAKAYGRRIGIAHFCGPDYPAAAKAAHATGTTSVHFFITAEGKVRDPGIETSSGNTDLDAAALECVKYWRYRPAVKDNLPIEAPWKANIQWSLPEPETPAPATPPATPPKP